MFVLYFPAKLQYVGRSGVAGSMRYTAHDNAPVTHTDRQTQNVIKQYVKDTDTNNNSNANTNSNAKSSGK